MKRRQRDKKSILIIGMGRFGQHLAMKFREIGDAVMVVDKSEATIQNMPVVFENSLIGDCTNENVISSLGVGNFDLCFVTIGKSFESAMVITAFLKNYGAKYIVSKAAKSIQVSLLKKVGADEVVYPEHEYAEKLAIKYSVSSIHDYIELSDGYAVYEIVVPKEWVGKTVIDLNIRKRYGINVLAIKNDQTINSMPQADYEFCTDDIVVISGHLDDINKLV